MKEWLGGFVAIVLLISCLQSLATEGKTKKIVSAFLKMSVVIVLVPLIPFFKGDVEKIFNESTEQIDVTVPQTEPEIVFAERYLEKKLAEKNIFCDVQITTENKKIQYVDIFLDENIINENDGNIFSDSDAVLKTVGDLLDVRYDQIRVYG